MRKKSIRTATTLQLDVADFLHVANKIPSGRFVKLLKAVIRAQLYDQWDIQAGLPLFETGDKAFTPANEIETWYWTVTRDKNKAQTIKRLNMSSGAYNRRHTRETVAGGIDTPQND